MKKPNTLSDLLYYHKSKSADKCAIKSDGNSYSFSELEILATNFALSLISDFKVKKGDRIVCIGEKSTELIAAALAIWKVGAIYVPVDKENGVNRTKFMIDDVNPTVIISSDKYLEKFGDAIGDIVTINYEYVRNRSVVESDNLSAISINGDDTSIIIYTSGSSGNPKGVCLSHQSVINYFYAENDLLKFDETGNNINFGPFHFDVSIQDTFLPLFFGAGVYLYDSFLIPELIVGLVYEFNVTHLICISSVFMLITGDDKAMEKLNNSRLKCCMVGGEVLDNKVVNYWLTKIDDLRFYNGYGPTECNSLCMAYHIKDIEDNRKRLYPIGKPFEGSKALLIDQDNNVITKSEVIGRLLIGGSQLMKGYWNLPDQTNKVFINIDNEKYYITGDLAQRDVNGDYIFEGRNDSEVKILGRRINLNEIRDNILKIPSINYSVIDVISKDEQKEIYAYVYVADHKVQLSKEAIIAHLKENLPEYMIPKHIFISNKVFKTSSNKVNEKQIRAYINQTYFKL